MLRYPAFASVLLGLAAAGSTWIQAQSPGPSRSSGAGSGQLAHALDQFEVSPFRAHMTFLADDRLEGRGTGTRGHEIAALYVATHFQAYGLKPAGDSGSYFQRVPLREITVVPEQCELVLARDHQEQALRWGDDFL